MADHHMNTEVETDELYDELEPEANEIMFGQQTPPQRPLTEKEKSKRKKIIMKLVDQKLKFKLIELMGQMIEKKSTNSDVSTSRIPTIDQMKIVDSNSTDSLTVPTDYQSLQNWPPDTHSSFHYPEQNWQSQFQTEWQSPIYHPQQYEGIQSSNFTSVSHQDYSSNIQHWHQPQNPKPSFNRKRIQRNINIVRSSVNVLLNIKSKSISSPAGKDMGHEANKSSTKLSGDHQGVTTVSQKKSHEIASTSQHPSCSLNSNQIIQDQVRKTFNNNRPKLNSINQATFNKQSRASNDRPMCRTSSNIRSVSMNNNRQFFDDDPIDSSKDWLSQGNNSICGQLAQLPQSSNVNEGHKSSNVSEGKTGDLHQPLGTRKRSRPSYFSQNNFNPIKSVDTNINVKASTKFDNKPGAKVNAKDGIKNSTTVGINIDDSIGTNAEIRIDMKAGTNADAKIDTNDRKQCSGNISNQWNMMNQLVMTICRNQLNQFEPFSAAEQKLQHKIIIQMSINPNSIRSNTIVAQKIGQEKLEEFINDCKNILSKISQADAEIKSNFSESRENTIKNLKALNALRVTTNEAENMQLVQNKIKNLIDPLLYSDNLSTSDEKDRNELINQLITNPHILEDNELAKEKIAGRNDVMRNIKNILDELIMVRPSKTFYFPLSRFIDVPFVVKVYDKSAQMTDENATVLREVLTNLIDSEQTQPKPKIIDMKFTNGSLVMVCTNRISFDWMEKMISNNFDGKWTGAHLTVDILPVKNAISKNALKTICLKFKNPQFLHFNNLMEQLKKDNPLLLTRRWELRTPQCSEFIDSTKCIYVGVDIESLVVLEEMNRVAVLRNSLVFFEINYDDNEDNFELINVVEKKMK